MITTTRRHGLARYAFAWAYLAAFVVTNIVYVCLPPSSRLALESWASTNTVNLRHNPVGCLVVSAFIPSGSVILWPILIAVALLGASKVLGSWRTALVCAAGHILGTLVSEGIVAYRISRGLLPESDSRIIDVGPSYVVVSALAVAILFAPWLVRILAGLALLLMIFVGGIFSGLSTLQVAAVGHLTAIGVGAGLGGFLTWRLRRRSRPPGRPLSQPR
ncbi:MAG TPA: rhomboid-like protein [Trebonia sp.]|nr:rhomboid-like protein [Trebonia sp.]